MATRTSARSSVSGTSTTRRARAPSRPGSVPSTGAPTTSPRSCDREERTALAPTLGRVDYDWPDRDSREWLLGPRGAEVEPWEEAAAHLPGVETSIAALLCVPHTHRRSGCATR